MRHTILLLSAVCSSVLVGCLDRRSGSACDAFLTVLSEDLSNPVIEADDLHTRPLPIVHECVSLGVHTLRLGADTLEPRTIVLDVQRAHYMLLVGKLGWYSAQFTRLSLENGVRVTRSPDGTIIDVTAYTDDVPDGESVMYYRDGRVWMRGRYTAGLRDGRWTSWFPNGVKETEGRYVDDLQDGEWRYWLPSGELRRVELFDRGILTAAPGQDDGPFAEHYSNGSLSIEGSFLNGKGEGEWRFWLPDGKLERELDFHEGRRVWSEDEEGRSKEERQ